MRQTGQQPFTALLHLLLVKTPYILHIFSALHTPREKLITAVVNEGVKELHDNVTVALYHSFLPVSSLFKNSHSPAALFWWKVDEPSGCLPLCSRPKHPLWPVLPAPLTLWREGTARW